MGIPNIQMLTNFARKYIPNITVNWETMKYYGLVYTKKKTISLSRNIPINSQKLTIPNLGPIEYDKEFKLTPGEQYFLCLLHEIGHFKNHLKIPKYYERIKKFVEKEDPNDKEKQIFAADYLLKPRKDEHLEAFDGRLKDLKTYILHGASGRIKEQMAVDRRTRKKFLKKTENDQ